MTKIIIIILLFILSIATNVFSEVIIDSDITFEKAIEGTSSPSEVIKDLVLLNVSYYSFDGKIHKGQLVVHKDVEQDLKEIFELILKNKFPVNKVIPIIQYNWSDDSSMADNNTSAFCYRFVAGTTRLSNHALGRAVDINPFNNPVIYENGKISPPGAKYNPVTAGTFSKEHPVVQEFIKLGWRWGGDFNSFKDYHHFDKK